jgi:hypothetical protein
MPGPQPNVNQFAAVLIQRRLQRSDGEVDLAFTQILRDRRDADLRKEWNLLVIWHAEFLEEEPRQHPGTPTPVRVPFDRGLDFPENLRLTL